MNLPPPPVIRPTLTKPAAAVANPASIVVLDFGPRQPQPICPRIILYAVEGWGKTTLAAHAPKPFILMDRGEDGYDTLLGCGRVPAVPAMTIETWTQLLATLESFAQNSGDRKTLVLDSMTGFERMCHEHVCTTEYGGQWGDKGFGSFQQGYDVSVTQWLLMLAKLERIHKKGIMVVFLAHATVKAFNNPTGANFDKYIIAAHHKTWGATAKMFDTVLFGNFRSIVEGSKGDIMKKGKGIGGAERVIYCDGRDAFVAKQRYGMPDCFVLSGDHKTSWGELWAAITSSEEISQ